MAGGSLEKKKQVFGFVVRVVKTHCNNLWQISIASVAPGSLLFTLCNIWIMVVEASLEKLLPPACRYSPLASYTQFLSSVLLGASGWWFSRSLFLAGLACSFGLVRTRFLTLTLTPARAGLEGGGKLHLQSPGFCRGPTGGPCAEVEFLNPPGNVAGDQGKEQDEG